MTRKTLNITDNLAAYLLQAQPELTPLEQRMLEETGRMTGSSMQIAPEQASLLTVLTAATGAERTLEIGVFTGYSTLAVARALPPHGRVVAMDVDAEVTRQAREYWREAGVEERIDLRIGPALETLDALLADGEAGRYDLAFIDADKRNYWHYFEKCLALIRPGGLIVIDNVLWSGKVADESVQDEQTLAIRDFNQRIRREPMVDHCLVPIADGVTLAVKRHTPRTRDHAGRFSGP
ncbi:MAG: class I SAM-dependent methyltransferase [Ectothiorhodospiraceae bacterium]|nr:class I SAM-dependent methyltransferase [Ectothiorhodospiraceae bacterium]MCH8503782.1 class I SAM-dependent methyltransferase [Ectothiorhodospiraceae bacterium]